MFALELKDTQSKEDSFFYFGGYSAEIIKQAGTKRNPDISADLKNQSKSDDGIFWMNINSNSHWEVYLYEAKFGGSSNAKIETSVDRVVIDSGASLNYLPPLEYSHIMN